MKKTLETLKRETMENPDSPLYQNVYVYVSDNGQTLPCEELSNDRIFVMPNRNTGGSGGFGGFGGGRTGGFGGFGGGSSRGGGAGRR